MPPRKKKVEKGTVGLDPLEVASADAPEIVTTLCAAISADGGSVLASYREPFAGNWIVMAALPIEKVAPTPFQRELSETHAKKLEAVIPKVGRFLDPVIVVRTDAGYWTPNGMHRLDAMNRLGAKSIVALVVPENEIIYRILALNTEKAHNLKDKSLEVVRMAQALAGDPETGSRPEKDWAFEFEEPAYLTIGNCYLEKKRFSGAAYMPVVRRCEAFFDEPIGEVGEIRVARATKLIAVDAAVNQCIKDLKEAGHQSAYLKPFVVARVNPLRFKKGKRGQIYEFDETIDKMIEKAENFDAGAIKESDLAASAGKAGD